MRRKGCRVFSHPQKEYRKFFTKLNKLLSVKGGVLISIPSRKHTKFKILLNEKSKTFVCAISGEVNSLHNVIKEVEHFLK